MQQLSDGSEVMHVGSGDDDRMDQAQGRLKVRHKAAGAAMLVPVLSGLLPSVGRPRCHC
jgi:hypothetical protein